MTMDLQKIADAFGAMTELDGQRLRDKLGEDGLGHVEDLLRVSLDRSELDEANEHAGAMEEERDRAVSQYDGARQLLRGLMMAADWEGYAARTKPMIYIGGEKDPYMIRWALVDGGREGNHVFLHKFIRDDEDRALHDHPWESVSILLSGTLREIDKSAPKGNLIHAGDIRFRSAQYAHRLIVEEQGFSLFCTGPKIREWGFLCPKGWRHWTRFTNGDSGELIGRGCADYTTPNEERLPINERVEAKREKLRRKK